MVYTIVLQRVQVSSLQSQWLRERDTVFIWSSKKQAIVTLRLNIYMGATSFVFFMLYG
jgi:hypothetical protein